jgi:pimeloyl-ACP methyl ester carboxylesterase
VALGGWPSPARRIVTREGKVATTLKNVALVHGGFADGAGWEGVYRILTKGGHHVSVVQNPTISLQDDVAVTRRVLAAQDGPTVLVGHSYGGAVITEAGISVLADEHWSRLMAGRRTRGPIR